MATERETGMTDEQFDIVSALYHALQGAQASQRYIADAEREGDNEVIDFFKDMQDQNRQMAERAKALLTRRVH